MGRLLAVMAALFLSSCAAQAEPRMTAAEQADLFNLCMADVRYAPNFTEEMAQSFCKLLIENSEELNCSFEEVRFYMSANGAGGLVDICAAQN